MAIRSSVSLDTINKNPPKDGFLCNAFGKATAKGKYFAWPKLNPCKFSSVDEILTQTPSGGLSNEICYIVKVTTPYKREDTINLKKYLDNPIDLTDKSMLKRINRKIQIVLSRLGVAFTDRAGAVEVTNKLPCSGWHATGGREGILINPHWVLRHDMQVLTRLIKKEVIHRSLFRNLYDLSNKRVLNFTLDVLAMRVIAQTPYGKLDKQTVKLAEKLFTTKIYKAMPFLALLDCSITAKQVKANLPPQIADIWIELYGEDPAGWLPPLNKLQPSALYFKIKAIVDEQKLQGAEDGDKGFQYPWRTLVNNIVATESGGDKIQNNQNISPIPNHQSSSMNNGVRKSFIPKSKRYGMGFSNEFTDFWDENAVEKESFVTERLSAFAKKWRTKNLLENAEAKLIEKIINDTAKLEVYPEDLTDDSILFTVCGITPELIPFYWNKQNGENKNRKKIAAFFDVSPSTQPFWPYMVHIIDRIEQECDVSFMRNTEEGVEEGAYTFAGSVKSLSKEEVEKMKQGGMPAGSSTCFDSVLSEVIKRIETDQLDCVICFTDGESSLSKKHIEDFNKTGKTFHRVYFRMVYSGKEPTEDITSDLDALNGESVTLSLPPADKADL